MSLYLSLGSVRQVGYVVRDIDRAMRHWASLGVGPWFCRKEIETTEFNYYGKSSKIPALSIALANSGDVQIELIQQNNDAPSLYLDSLEKNGETAQHVAYWTMGKFDEWCGKFIDLGFVEGHSGRMGAKRGRFAYFVKPDVPGMMVELSESTGGKAEYFEQIRKTHLEWDGTDSIRYLTTPRS